MSHDSDQERYTFPKSDRLCSQLAFDHLFKNGASFTVGRLKFFFAFDLPPALVSSPLMVAFAAPKRLHKKAVTRNYLKRRMRESFRLNRIFLHEELQRNEHNLVLLIKYNSKKLSDYHYINRCIVKATHILNKKLAEIN